MANKCLVTGANGHLGNNLVRALLKKGEKVRASVRNINYTKPFAGLNCEIVHADLLNKEALLKAMEGIDILYQVAAVSKQWVKNPEIELLHVNVQGTQNVLEVASEKGVKKIIYVSSMATLDPFVDIMDETTWAKELLIPYNKSKYEAEKLAWRLAKELDLWMVSVLPSSMVGPNCFGHLTTTMKFLNRVINNELPVDINFWFNYVDIADVANAMITASEKGKSGERYLLGNESPTNTGEVVEIAKSIFPNIKSPKRISKTSLMLMAFFEELFSKISKKEPAILRNQIKTYYDNELRLDITKARKELGFNPRSPEQALKDTFIYLKNRKE
jgi:dihydroflavonol-4-reductase